MKRLRRKSIKKMPTTKPIDKERLLKDLIVLLTMTAILILTVWFFDQHRLEIGLAGGFVIFAFLLWRILSLYLNANEFSERKDFIDLHAKILGSAALVISLLFTWQGIKNNQTTALENQKLTLQGLQNAEKKQIEDRYNTALEQLGSEKREARLGAIYSLGKIANDSIKFAEDNQELKSKTPDNSIEADKKIQEFDDLYWEIVQTLASYVRGNSPKSEITKRPSEEMPTDIQAALNVLAWRRRSYLNGEKQRLDLYSTDLRGLVIKDVENAGNNLQHTGGNFENARMTEVNFESAKLRGINFKDALLSQSIFKHAELMGADLEGADLSMAKITLDQIISTQNWEKIRRLPKDVCVEIQRRGNINIPQGCK